MKRLIILIVVLAAAAAALYYSEHHRQETRVGPEAVLNALADTQRELSRVPATMTRISNEEEIGIGDTLAERYSIQYGTGQYGTGDAAMQDYVTAVGRKVAGHARRKFDYKFHYVPDESLVNAFALPGGHVFIGKGMVRLMQTEDELASVLGHEVEHIDNYHCVERYQLKAHMHDLPLAELLALPVQIFQAGYGKEQEMEADRDGIYLAVMAGYSPQGAVHLFERFKHLHHEYVLKAGSPDQELSQVAMAGLEGYFRSHPLPEERVNQIQRLIAAKKWASVPERTLRVRPDTPQTTAGNQ
jgi:predicted Zn-dependent protease